MDFKQALINDEELINSSFEKYLRDEKCPEGRLNESTKYSLTAGGKRLRPILIIEVYKLFKDNTKECIPFAIAMEMIHTFSLIHDDLPGIDNDDYRRGKLTNHKKFNEATAILAGDSLLNNAYMIMIDDIINSKDEIIKSRKVKAMQEISFGIDRMIAGEYIDTEYEGKQISNDYLEYMHKNKTGALIKASVRTGAIIAGAEDKDIEKLSIYAEKIGLAFQIKDDILSEIGDAKVLGKPVGNDKEKGKCTYVSKYGLEEAKKMLKNIIEESVEIISAYNTDNEFLKELALYIANRNK